MFCIISYLPTLSAALVIYHCVTVAPKQRLRKQHGFMMSLVLWVRNLYMTKSGPLAQGFAQGCNQVRQETTVISSLNSGLIFQVHSCSYWQDLAPCWLLARGSLSVLP